MTTQSYSLGDNVASRAGAEAELPLMTVPQVATMLTVSCRTVQRLARTGKIPCLRFGRCMRFERAQVKALLQDLLDAADHGDHVSCRFSRRASAAPAYVRQARKHAPPRNADVRETDAR